MFYETLISVEDLAAHQGDRGWLIADARFSLTDAARGQRDYLQAHIPGAVYAHLDHDLSAHVIPGQTGRHPWPQVETASALFSKWGVDNDVQVVAYDDAGGALAAVRVWGMLRWLGHPAVAVLDGGWQRWNALGLPLRGEGEPPRGPRRFQPRPHPEYLLTSDEIDKIRQDPAYRLLDARAADRFRGENEVIDPVAGHIPGALSAPYQNNLASDGRFRTPEALNSYFRELLSGVPAWNAVAYCGSGVTSLHNVLAIAYAGLGQARLYAGSWSEWITGRSRPIEK